MSGSVTFRDILSPSQNIPGKLQNGTEKSRNLPCFFMLVPFFCAVSVTAEKRRNEKK